MIIFMYDIVFFVSCTGPGGMLVENDEEINVLKSRFKLLVLPCETLSNLNYILEKHPNCTIYIDFVNCDMRLLDHLKTCTETSQVILKYKGRVLHHDVVQILSSIAAFRSIVLLTTAVNASECSGVTVVKYWGLDLNKILAVQSPHKVLYFKESSDLAQQHIARFKFFYVGRPCEFKGLRQLTKAFSDMDSEDCALVIVSTGRVVVNEPRVTVFNNLDYCDCMWLMSKYCDCLLMPSVDEGFGRVAVEALVFGKLLISTKNTMLYDMMPDNAGVVYIDRNDSDTIRVAMMDVRTRSFDSVATASVLSKLESDFTKFPDIFKK